MWSAFTGQRAIYQALVTSWAGQVEVSIDGITREVVSLVNPTTAIRTFAYTNLGNEPHVLQVRLASGRATVDAFITSQSVIRFTYDPLSRLTSATYSGDYTYTFGYAYDAVGNRTVQTATITSTQVTNYAYDPVNHLSSVNGQTDTWDDNGNLVNDGNKTYTYDQANRLTNISGAGLTWSASYNGDGARFKQIINGSITTYTLDLAAPLVQALVSKDGSGDTRYLYGVTRIGEQQTGGWVYHLSDAIGSVRQLADGSGQVALARGYTPYGEPLWSQGMASSRYAFTGED